MNDVWQICKKGQPKRLRCRTKRTSPNKKNRKEKKNNTIKTREMRCTYANVFVTWIDLCFSCNSKGWQISRSDYSRAGTDVHMDFRRVRLPACLPAGERQLRKKEHQKAPPPSSKTNLQTGYDSARQRIVNVFTCASSHGNHKLNKPVFGRLLPSSSF